MVLHNEHITQPLDWKNETFTGTTTLDYDGGGSFNGCSLNAQGSRYAIRVPAGRRPLTAFRESSILGATGKLVLGGYLGFFSCEMRDAPDGVFGQLGGMWLHIEDCDIDVAGDLPNHTDCVQSVGGYALTIKDSRLSVRGSGANSCVYLESLAPPVGQGPVRRVRIVNNILDGGGYLVWSIEDPNAPGGPNSDIVIAGNVGKNWIFNQPVAWSEGSKPLMFNNSWQ